MHHQQNKNRESEVITHTTHESNTTHIEFGTMHDWFANPCLWLKSNVNLALETLFGVTNDAH